MNEDQRDRARAFPPQPPYRKGRRFAQTWWGEAWIDAMLDSALDPEPLKKGRRYAAAGHVGTITVSTGRVSAPVYGGEDVPFESLIRLEELSGDQWARFLEQIVLKSGHIAELLDRRMPQELVEDAAEAGVPFLPGIGDLDPECTCTGFELPCKHAAALSYQVARLLDEDPFVLLLMRGRTEDEVLEEVRRLSSRGPEAAQETDDVPCVPAEQVLGRDVPPLLDPPPLPDRPRIATEPGAIAAAPSAPGAGPAALERLASDAALRAREMLVRSDGADPAAGLDEWHDAVRMAATHGDPEIRRRLDTLSRHGMDRPVLAWTFGGAVGLETLQSSWQPGRHEVARADSGLAAAWEEHVRTPKVRVWRNRWTLDEHDAQLRYGRDGRWYPYRRYRGRWWPAGPPETDVAIAAAGLLDERAAEAGALGDAVHEDDGGS